MIISLAFFLKKQKISKGKFFRKYTILLLESFECIFLLYFYLFWGLIDHSKHFYIISQILSVATIFSYLNFLGRMILHLYINFTVELFMSLDITSVIIDHMIGWVIFEINDICMILRIAISGVFRYNLQCQINIGAYFMIHNCNDER